MLRLPIVLLLFTAPLAAQQDPAAPVPADAYLDAGARQLLERARSFRNAADSSILSYTAIVKSRIGAGLRSPLKDRTLFREESASRVRWSRSDRSVVLPLAFRQQTPAGVGVPGGASGAGIDELFDPTQDRIYFGIGNDEEGDGDDEVWVAHPLVPGAEQFYRYQSGDTLTIRLQDGRVLRSIELRALPRERSPHTFTGSLWIDAATGAVAQAVFRLTRPMDLERDANVFDDDDDIEKVPGVLRPFEFDLSLLVIEYSLWEFEHWMPRFMRMEGYLRAGFLHAPGAFEVSYDILDVQTDRTARASDEGAAVDSVLADWQTGAAHRVVNRRQDGRELRVLMPRDSLSLLTGAELPPPIWEDAPEFATEGELRDLYERISELPGASTPDRIAPRFVWGPGGADLLRYNRVEALSVGARVMLSLPYVDASLAARLGAADLEPGVEVSLLRATHERTLRLEGYHALAPFDAFAGSLGLGNSMAAVLFGRDDGEYFRATGARLSLLPHSGVRQWYELSLYAQRERAVERETNVALPRLWNPDFAFRRVIAAAPAELAGAALLLRPWWGTDPLRPQLGLEVFLEGAGGDYEFVRGSATLRAAAPLGTGVRAGVELGAGTTEGTSPVQRWWLLGGPATLRGYPGSTTGGTSFARARLEVARTFGWGGLAVFGDGGWAGERAAIDGEDALASAGVGFSVLDGLLRFDLARALRSPTGWRLELYLDALL